MRFTTYLMLAAALFMAGIILFQTCVLINRRWAGRLPVYPPEWSPEQVLAWERWRLVLGLMVIALWLWGGAVFCLGLLLSPTVALVSLGFPVLYAMLMLTYIWLSVASATSNLSKPRMWFSVLIPTTDLSKLTPKQLTWAKVFALVMVFFAFVGPILIVDDLYFSPPAGANVPVRGP